MTTAAIGLGEEDAAKAHVVRFLRSVQLVKGADASPDFTHLKLAVFQLAGSHMLPGGRFLSHRFHGYLIASRLIISVGDQGAFHRQAMQINCQLCACVCISESSFPVPDSS